MRIGIGDGGFLFFLRIGDGGFLYFYRMPRKARLSIPGAVTHVMACCLDGLLLFADDDDRTFFLRLLAQYVNETGCRCYAWALMPNHYHLLLRNGDVDFVRTVVEKAHARRLRLARDRGDLTPIAAKVCRAFGIAMDSLLQRLFRSPSSFISQGPSHTLGHPLRSFLQA